MATAASHPEPGPDFIRQIVADDLAHGRHDVIVTRFPPEPNGHLHIGHAKAICLNFEIARENAGGRCHLRFDDTNPVKEDDAFVRAMQQDIHWLGYEWGEHCYWASDYFERLYDFAEQLVRNEQAYVDSLSADEIRAHRGTLTAPGRDSPHRTRGIDENLALLRGMRAGEFPDGAHVLRAKIDMASPNLVMRDPVLYRIRHVPHHRTGTTWCIYPTYDFAHPLSDGIEGITHSLCSLEFAEHRPFYDWVLAAVGQPAPPKQIEFARLNVSYTVLSKRRLQTLVTEGHVDDWDDPRMPTLAGLRRRGYTATALRTFVRGVGVAKRDSLVDVAMLEHAIRDELNQTAPRVMAVLRPLKLIIDSWDGDDEWLDAVNNPEDPSQGTRRVPFGRELYIERDDFHPDPPKKYFRLAPGREVRLRWAYIVRCTDVVRDADGTIVEVHCTHDATSRGGTPADGRKVKGTIHWVAAPHALDATVALYDRLFTTENPSGDDWLSQLNPTSRELVEGCKVEPSLAGADPDTRYQFERLGYFRRDPTADADRLAFNRIVTLRDTWAKLSKKAG